MKYIITGYETPIEIEAEDEEAAMAEYIERGFVEIEQAEEEQNA